MSRDYRREFTVKNWPPGMTDPAEPPEGYVRELLRADDEHWKAMEQLRAWHLRQEERKRAAWVEYHDARGWPDDPGYQKRLRRGVKGWATP